LFTSILVAIEYNCGIEIGSIDWLLDFLYYIDKY